MMPLMPFIAGLFAGAATVSALRSERARSVMNDTGSRLCSAVNEAESGVRTAARAGLDKLRCASPEAAAEPAANPAEAPEAAASPQAAPVSKPARARKRARPPSAEAVVAAPKPKRAPRKPKAEETEA